MAAIDLPELRACLARRRLRQVDLAKNIGVPVTTLSAWLRGVHPGPADLPTRIERALRLTPDSLSRNEK